MQAYRPKALTDEDNRIRASGCNDALDFVGVRVRCQVGIVRLPTMQQHVTHRSAYHIQLFTLRVKCFRQRDDDI